KLALITLLLPHQRDLPEREDLVWVPYPLSPADLIRSVEETERQAALNALRGEAQAPEKKGPEGRSAEERLLILKAKNTLMEGRGMTEAQAHRFLQKSSMDRGLKLIDAARMVMEKSLDVL
ncbi:MAG: ANTAR domain-containing protein, partial [Spirochaetales bacterium]|nr:ANTAR domain-containing protein [Spirochaetales bacterium]